MEALAYPICLGVLRLSFGMVDIVNGQIQLVVVLICLTAELRTSVCEHPQDTHAMLFKEGQYTVIEQICCSDRCLHGVELRHGYFRVSINEGLLIDPSNTF